MAQTLVQTSAELSFTGTTNTITITATAGNAFAVYGAQITDGTAIVAPTDDKGDSFTLKHTETAGNGCGAVAEAVNVVGGSTVITLGVASGSKAQRFKVQEWSGCANAGQPDASDSNNQAANTSHNESAAGINPSTGCVVFSSSSCANNLTSPAAGSGYNSVASSAASVWWQYQIFTVAPTNEQALWSSSNSTAQSGSVMALKAAAAGGGRLARNSDLSGIGGTGQQCFNPTLSI